MALNPASILAQLEEEEDLDGPEDFSSKPLRAFDDMLRCPICRCLMSIPVLLSSCQHNFCSECVRGHLRNTNAKNECPIRYCCQPFQERDIIPNQYLGKLILIYETEVRDNILRLEEDANNSSDVEGRKSSDEEDSEKEEDVEDDEAFEAPAQNFLQKPKFKKTQAAVVFPEARIPPLNLHMMKLPQLRAEVQKHGLSAKGDKLELERRYHRYKQLYEAELDSDQKRSIAQIVKQVEKEEQSLLNTKKKKSSGNIFRSSSKKVQAATQAKQKAGFLMLAASMQQSVQGSSNRPNDAQSKAEMCFKAWRKVYSKRLGRPYYYNTMTRMGQFEPPVQPEPAVEPTPDSMPELDPKQDGAEKPSLDRPESSSTLKGVEVPETLGGLSRDEQSLHTPSPLRKSSRKRKAITPLLSGREVRSSGQPSTTKGGNSSLRNTSAKPSSKTEAMNAKTGKHTIVEKPMSNRSVERKKKKPLAAGQKRLSRATMSSQSTPKASSKEEATCFICGKTGSTRWVTLHIDKCLQSSENTTTHSPAPDRSASPSF